MTDDIVSMMRNRKTILVSTGAYSDYHVHGFVIFPEEYREEVKAAIKRAELVTQEIQKKKQEFGIGWGGTEEFGRIIHDVIFVLWNRIWDEMYKPQDPIKVPFLTALIDWYPAVDEEGVDV